jgi:hypothetical protein
MEKKSFKYKRFDNSFLCVVTHSRKYCICVVTYILYNKPQVTLLSLTVFAEEAEAITETISTK